MNKIFKSGQVFQFLSLFPPIILSSFSRIISTFLRLRPNLLHFLTLWTLNPLPPNAVTVHLFAVQLWSLRRKRRSRWVVVNAFSPGEHLIISSIVFYKLVSTFLLLLFASVVIAAVVDVLGASSFLMRISDRNILWWSKVFTS